MATKRPSYLKRQKEQKRVARAAEKREERQRRKQEKPDGDVEATKTEETNEGAEVPIP